MANRQKKDTNKLFFDENGNQKKWLILFGIFIPLLTTIVFSYWGIKISKDSADNKEQIEALTKIITESRQQVGLLQKIFIATDSTNKSSTSLKEIPNKLAKLSSTLDILNFSLLKETKRLENSYLSLNNNYDQLINQQKEYLDKFKNVIDLTNKEIEQLSKNNQELNKKLNKRAKPDLIAVLKKKNNKYYLERFRIQNEGDIELDVESLFITLSNKQLLREDSVTVSDDCFVYDSSYDFHFKISCTPKRVIPRLPLEMLLTKKYLMLSNYIDIYYTLTFKNDNESPRIDAKAKLVIE